MCQNAAYGDLCSREVQVFGRCEGCLLQSLWECWPSWLNWGPCWTGARLQGAPACAAGTMFPVAPVHHVIPPPYCSETSPLIAYGVATGELGAVFSFLEGGGKSHLWKFSWPVLCSEWCRVAWVLQVNVKRHFCISQKEWPGCVPDLRSYVYQVIQSDLCQNKK